MRIGRLPAAGDPPALPGLTTGRLLGRGGSADVYLYERVLPRMPVAVKVFPRPGPGDATARRVVEEANAMALLRSHPCIVPVLEAGVAGDGRPFVVMAYYPGEDLQTRAARRPLAVPETLRIVIQLAGALETAHRAGIVHRDVKPANVLTDEFGTPALTDFGLAAAAGGRSAAGVSVRWAAPEVLEEWDAADVRADVYSLAATAYTLLAGRAPFDVAGGSLRELMERIEHARVPPTGREDVPETLERLLASAMAKRPELRPPSAASFARDVQEIERRLHLRPTPLVVPVGALSADDPGRTRRRPPGPADPTRTRIRPAEGGR